MFATSRVGCRGFFVLTELCEQRSLDRLRFHKISKSIVPGSTVVGEAREVVRTVWENKKQTYASP